MHFISKLLLCSIKYFYSTKSIIWWHLRYNAEMAKRKFAVSTGQHPVKFATSSSLFIYIEI